MVHHRGRYEGRRRQLPLAEEAVDIRERILAEDSIPAAAAFQMLGNLVLTGGDELAAGDDGAVDRRRPGPDPKAQDANRKSCKIRPQTRRRAYRILL